MAGFNQITRKCSVTLSSGDTTNCQLKLNDITEFSINSSADNLNKAYGVFIFILEAAV